MHLKLKYVLPVVQMILAAITIWWFYLWINLADRIYDAPGNPVGFTAMLLMNAPASALRNLFYDINPRWADAMYIGAVGALWRLVAFTMESLSARKTVAAFRKVPFRVATDMVLIAVGPSSIWAFRTVDLVHVAQFDWPWFAPDVAACLFWAVGPPIIFGRDIVLCVREKASWRTGR